MVRTELTIKAEGVTGEYLLLFPTAQAQALAFLSVTLQGQELVVDAPVSSTNFTQYRVAVPGETAPTLKVLAIFTGLLEPFPAEIGQSDNQLVKYTDNHYFLSPYRTETQRTAYTLASTAIESYTKRPPSSVRGSSVVFGPYKDIAPMEASPMIIHSVNNKPFAKFRSLAKEVEVSHWGMISVEEVVELQHAGARLKGGFNRFEYQSKRYGDSPSFRMLRASLPAEATNIYCKHFPQLPPVRPPLNVTYDVRPRPDW